MSLKNAIEAFGRMSPNRMYVTVSDPIERFGIFEQFIQFIPQFFIFIKMKIRALY